MDILTEAVGCDYFYPNFEGDNDYTCSSISGLVLRLLWSTTLYIMTISVLLMEWDQP